MSARGRTDSQLSRIGVIALVVLVVALAAALNLQKFPGLRGTSYTAELSDASGLREGNMVQIAGVRVGRVGKIELPGDRVVVNFTVDAGQAFGNRSGASVEVLNLLGEKFLNLRPAGGRPMAAGGTIPLDRTDASYDIVKVFDELTDTTERIDIPQLQTALNTVSDTMNRTSDEAGATFVGLSRLSTVIAERDVQIQSLLKRANSVSRLLAARKGDLVRLIKDGDAILTELKLRRAAIRQLLVNTRQLADQLGGLIKDNEEQIGPMLERLRSVTQLLVDRDKDLRASIKNLGPYVDILSNVIGTGPWFDAYAANFFKLGTGEFVPVVRQ
jgi:phospholipid/cholesterol/gamma-HCH transport system substrate-binding protein